jgi:alkylation response protein AidB-like acyl-CoA dehydrogenase
MEWFSEDIRLLKDTVARAARDKIAPLAAQIDREGEFNREVESLLWDLGVLSILLPPEHGGMDRDKCTALCVCIEEIAKVCAASALNLIIQAVGSFPILHAGSPEILEKYWPPTWSPSPAPAPTSPASRPAPKKKKAASCSTASSSLPPTAAWPAYTRSWPAPDPSPTRA